MRSKDFAELFAAIRRGDLRPALGTLALSASNVLKLALQTAVIPVLARLLGPGAYGLVALAIPFILLANVFASAGLGNALVRERSSSRELESTIFWLSLGISLSLAILISLFAGPISRLMSAPTLVPILIALTLILPLSGALSVPNARISRERKFSIFAVSEAAASIVSAIVAVGAALMGLGAWSLVIQLVLLWVIKIAWLFPASGFRPLAVFRPKLVWPHLHFGLNSVGANLTDFAAKSFSTLLVGSLIGVVAAGHYAMGYQLVRVPELIISGPLYITIFASMARWGNDLVGAKPVALKGLRGVVTLLGPLFAGLALVAALLVKVVLGPAWTATGPILIALAPAGFFLCSFDFIGATLLGLGRSDLQFRLILLSGVLLVAGTLLGARFGAVGVAAGMSVGAGLAAPAYLYALGRQFGMSVWALLRELIAPLLATLAMAALVFALGRHLDNGRPMLDLVLMVLSGAVSFPLALAVFAGPRLMEDLQWMLGTSPGDDAPNPQSETSAVPSRSV